ncbi:MAG: LuxR C-terminal-related transcriptional regulator [Panacagrimonas sp.]
MLRSTTSSLSPRERVALDHLKKGLSNQQIAEAMGISVNTIKAHLKNIFLKLDTRSRARTFAQIQIPRRCIAPCEQDKAVAKIASHRVLQTLLDGLTAGATNKQLARTLTLSPNTIKFHLKSIYRELGAKNRVETLAILIERSATATQEASMPEVTDRPGIEYSPGSCFLQPQ